MKRETFLFELAKLMRFWQLMSKEQSSFNFHQRQKENNVPPNCRRNLSRLSSFYYLLTVSKTKVDSSRREPNLSRYCTQPLRLLTLKWYRAMIYFPGTSTFNTLPTSHLVIFLTGKVCFLIHKVVLPWMLLSFREMVRSSSYLLWGQP